MPAEQNNSATRADAANIFFPVLRRKAQAKALGKFFAVTFFQQSRRGRSTQGARCRRQAQSCGFLGVQFMIDQVANRALAASA